MKKIYSIIICILYILLFHPLTHAEPKILITEFVSDNHESLQDEDGDAPDWIELYNAGDEDINLAGWSLTDDRSDLQQWKFPEIILEEGDYLIVFASSKYRVDPEKELHTNFNLNVDGEYLALVDPDGETIHYEFFPTYPPQREDVSYGYSYKNFQFIDQGSPALFYVPEDESLGNHWKELNYDEGAWNSAELSLGYGSKPGSFTVNVYQSNRTLTNLSTADQVIENPSYQIDRTTALDDVINYADENGGGNYDPNNMFPGLSWSHTFDDFVVLATTSIVVSQEGVWTFGINSDDGARLRIDDKNVINDDNTHAPKDTFGTVELDKGEHDLELTFFERAGGAELELFAAKGEHSSFDASVFHLVGNEELEGLSLGGFDSLIHSSIESEMRDENASVYVRIPFTVEDASVLSSLHLNVFYNDGFIAYLNGKEIARRNAPQNATWNSTALQVRSDEDTLASESFTITLEENDLIHGENLLAFHGLNTSHDDNDFLLYPQLTSAVLQDEIRYFTSPTPGEPNHKGYKGFVDDIYVTKERGFYENPIEIELFCQTPNAEIRYTLDGSEPRADHGHVYNGPITIDETTPLRAAGFLSEYHPSNITTQTYIFLNDVFQQTRPSGYPTVWTDDVPADYEMDSRVVEDSEYRDLMEEAMKSIPTLSLVTERDHLFSSDRGIYTHTLNKGVEWERPASAELIYPDGQKEHFQVDHGLRIQGGTGRLPHNKKHSLRLLFKRDYGPPKLRYPLFENSPVETFDTVVLRGYFNYSWHSHEGGFGSNIGQADYIRDEFSRRTQLALGQYGSHGRYFHVYLNGLYWGLYNMCERPDDSFSAEHIGGEKEEWDCVTSGTRGINHTRVKAGNKDTWNAMMELAEEGGFDDPEKYEAIQEYVHIPALIDYMLTIYYTGNRDAPTVIGGGGKPWNFYSSHWREGYSPFRFYCWDSEWTLEEPTRNVVTFHDGYENPAMIFNKLKKNPDFVMFVADHIQRHFFNGGALTPEASIERYQELKNTIDLAVIAESARWGDVRTNKPKTRNENWIPEVQRILNNYLPQRTKIVLDQLRRARWFPKIDAPEFNQHGGKIEPGFQLTMKSQEVETTTEALVSIDDLWKYDQSGRNLGSAWKEWGYNDDRWNEGNALLYVESSSLPAPKNTLLRLGKTTYYFRTTFDIPSTVDLDDIALEMQTIIDDGAIVYINGLEVYRMRMPGGEIKHSDFASETVSVAEYEGPFNIPTESLREGENLIAVEVHQTNADSSDIVFGLELNAVIPTEKTSLPIYYTLDGSDPRLSGGEISNRAQRYEEPVTLSDTTHVKARALKEDRWSALSKAEFFVDANQTNLAMLQEHLHITEVMYNPQDGNEYEFVELHNSHESESLPLTGVGFTDGIEYTFPPGATISPQSYILVGRVEDYNMNSLRAYYQLESDIPIYGPYRGKLANEGERVTLSHIASQTEFISFKYDDGRGWPMAADGAGHSIVPLPEIFSKQNESLLDYGGNWRASDAIHGSPAEEDPIIPPSMQLNEIAANTSNPDANHPYQTTNDWVEFYNASNNEIHLEGWYLSNEEENLKKWPLPADEIPPYKFISYDKNSGLESPLTSLFELSYEGDDLYLSYLPGVHGEDRVVDAVTFQAQEEGFTLGRVGEKGRWWDRMRPTQNATNEEAITHVVINELMYWPLDETELNPGSEYIELFNPHYDEVELWNNQDRWRIDGGVRYTFPANATIPAQGYALIVGFNPNDTAQRNAFMQKYELDEDVQIYGPYEGKLSNTGERIALEKPLDRIDLQPNAWGLVDEVIYFHDEPWEKVKREELHSLTRLDADKPGNDSSNWVSVKASPGKMDTAVEGWSLY